MSGKEHRNTKAICSIDNFLITNRSTWLNYCGSASSSGLFLSEMVSSSAWMLSAVGVGASSGRRATAAGSLGGHGPVETLSAVQQRDFLEDTVCAAGAALSSGCGAAQLLLVRLRGATAARARGDQGA